MKRFFVLFILLFLVISCKHLIRENSLCGEFIIEIKNYKKYNNPIKQVKLLESLNKKFDMIKNSNSDNICRVDLNIQNTVYDSIVSGSGITSKRNIKVFINYNLFLNSDDKPISNGIGLFYNDNTIQNRYSDYRKKKDVEDKLIERISEEIFLDIMKYL